MSGYVDKMDRIKNDFKSLIDESKLLYDVAPELPVTVNFIIVYTIEKDLPPKRHKFRLNFEYNEEVDAVNDIMERARKLGTSIKQYLATCKSPESELLNFTRYALETCGVDMEKFESELEKNHPDLAEPPEREIN
jgi:hypothetical protein